ncbi:hypothetical protein E2562_017923 [Oryza meyeriana var. granulata]|uniref:DUF668 domain-containing protein n=1 Tax=Oryza meyeriana var. granulata TaxID=110450 RepID=A0A6G1CPK0_9ORYZ|nr:hypothetical protein E2562_017923 [Oryza meyeriana var. granulata]
MFGLVCGSLSSSDDEGFTSHGEKKQQQPPATTLPSSRKSWRRKTAPVAADEHKEGDEGPPPASKTAALLDKRKEKESETDTSVRRTSKGKPGNPSEDSNKAVAKTPTLKAVIGSIKTYIAIKKGRKIKILAFEVANIIAKGSNLMKFLSEENIKHLKSVVLQNQGVQHMISNDQNQLLALVGDEIREQFKDFAAGVARLGKMCRDPKWHNLDKNFSGLECGLITQEYSHETAASKMEHLMELAHRTKILFHALRLLEASEDMYKNAKEQDLPLRIFRNAMNIEKGNVRSAKKESLWAKKMEHIVEELVYIVHFLPSEINCVFYKEHEEYGSVKTNGSPQETLGSADLSLHYAKIIIAIKNLAYVASSVPNYGVDSLFIALPYSIKSGLLPKMRRRDRDDERTETQIVRDMSKKLEWLLPMAESTTRLSQHSGTIGECLLTGTLNGYDQAKVLKIQTLYHADKMKIEGYIKDMVMDLHLLIKAAKRKVDAAYQSSTLDQSAIQEATGLASTATSTG